MAGNNSKNKKINPYISFVVAARNDNYGGDFLHRIQNFFDNILALANKHSLEIEIVVVEWNPPLNKKRLREVLTLPGNLKPGQVRFIEVPKEIHKKFPNSEKMPIFEYIAKNVGIRRARGKYVIATNPDIIFSEELIEYLAKRGLSPDCFYRVDRYDVRKRIPSDLTVDEKLLFCEKNWFRVHSLDGTKYSIKNSLLSMTIADSLKILRILISKFKSSIFKKIFSRSKNDKPLLLHTNASGDFFLMARSNWYKLRGYPELPSHSYIDGFLCYMASSVGLSQIILNDKKIIYHQEHDRSQARKRPFTNYQYYNEKIKKLMEEKPVVFNDENWGLGNIELKEYYL